jgi:hypothetical protein
MIIKQNKADSGIPSLDSIRSEAALAVIIQPTSRRVEKMQFERAAVV